MSEQPDHPSSMGQAQEPFAGRLKQANLVSLEELIVCLRQQRQNELIIQEALIHRAKLEEYAEEQAEMLASLLQASIEMLADVDEAPDADWQRRREKLTARALSFPDPPPAPLIL